MMNEQLNKVCVELDMISVSHTFMIEDMSSSAWEKEHQLL